MNDPIMHSSIGGQLGSYESDTERGQFINDCRFAKVVDTKDGKALLIGGAVINISSSAYPGLHADWLARALRQGGLAPERVSGGPLKAVDAGYGRIGNETP